jgi:hypothetical protein
MRHWILAALCAAALGVGVARADDPPPADHTLSQADAEKLVKLLSADDYDARQDALKKLQGGIGENMRHMVLVQEALIRLQQSLAAQLKVLTMAQDLEAVARTASLMEFNEALSKWAIAAMELPDAQRAEVLKWGLSDDGMQVVGRAYSPRADVRVQGIAEMAKVPGTAVSILLGKMVMDSDRVVSIAAMDGLWDRPATPETLSALWQKSVVSMAAMYGGQRTDVRNRIINFHGRAVNVITGPGYNNGNYEDGAIATDVLVHLHSPDTETRLKTFLAEFANGPIDPNNGAYRYQMFLPNYGGPGQDMQRLIDAFKPKEIVSVYMHFLLAQTMNDGNNGETDIGGKKYRYGTKLDMIGRVCKATDQEPDTYGIKKIPQLGDRYVIDATDKGDDAAMTKLKAWWEQHKAEYGEKPAAAMPKK